MGEASTKKLFRSPCCQPTRKIDASLKAEGDYGKSIRHLSAAFSPGAEKNGVKHNLLCCRQRRRVIKLEPLMPCLSLSTTAFGPQNESYPLHEAYCSNLAGPDEYS